MKELVRYQKMKTILSKTRAPKVASAYYSSKFYYSSVYSLFMNWQSIMEHK